jgi:hypothetical protein
MKIKNVSRTGFSQYAAIGDDCMINKMYRVSYWKPSKKKQANKRKQRRRAS